MCKYNITHMNISEKKNIQALAIDEATFHTSKNSYYTKNKTSTSLPTSVLFLVKRSAQYQDLLKKNQYM